MAVAGRRLGPHSNRERKSQMPHRAPGGSARLMEWEGFGDLESSKIRVHLLSQNLNWPL